MSQPNTLGQEGGGASSRTAPQAGLADLLKQKVDLDAKIQDEYFREKTFMAIDVQKSADLKKGKNQDDVFLTFDGYHQLVRRATEENAGQVHETAGDGIMCVFDDAGAACKAAIKIQTGMPEFNQVVNRLKKPMVLRIGLNTGRVLIDKSRSIGELFDAVIDTAGHLQKEGRGGEVLITQATLDTLGDKGLFVKDKFWEAKQIQLYRYAVDTGIPGAPAPESDADVPEEFRGMEKFTPVLDIVNGKSFREIELGGVIWIKRPSGVFSEGRVTLSRLEDDFGVLVVNLPDGTMAYGRIRSSLRLCTNYDRAYLNAMKTIQTPQMQKFDGENPVQVKIGGAPMSTWVAVFGAVGVVILLFLVVAILLFK